MLPIENKIS